MKYWCILLLCVAPVGRVIAEDVKRLRPIDAGASEALERAVERSPLARVLVERLKSSNLVVHIETSRALPTGIAGTMRFVTSRGGYRYVRITLALDLPLDARIAVLGHELQHACEVAGSGANDIAGIRKLYESWGYRTPGDGELFETAEAVAAERQVRRELHSGVTVRGR